MSILLAPLPVQSFRDSNGNPLAGGLLYTYQAGTSTLQTTYTDATGATPNANPVVLNSRGEASVWLTSAQAFKLVLQDSYGVLIWSVDQVVSGALSGANSDILSLSGLTTALSIPQGGTGATTATAAAVALGITASADLAAGGGAGLVGANTYQTQDAVNRDRISVKRFGAKGDNITDDAAAIQAAINYVFSAGGGDLYFPASATSYKVTATLVLPSGVRLVGSGPNARWRNNVSPVKINFIGSVSALSVTAPPNVVVDTVQITGIHFDGTNAAAGCHGLVFTALGSLSTAIEGVLTRDVTVTNFPGNQILQNGQVFDVTHNRLSILNPNRASLDCMLITNGPSSQISLIDCWVSPYTAGTWGVKQDGTGGPQDLRFFGGTVAPLDSSTVGANGVYVGSGGLYIYGTHIEDIGTSTTSVGVQYSGSNGAFISTSQCSGFGANIKIGNANSMTAAGWVISGNVSGHTPGGKGEVWITSGGSRIGSILSLGFGNGSPVIVNDRLTSDGVDEIAYLLNGTLQNTKVQASNGGPNSPSITFAGQPDLGFFSVGASTMGLATSGISQLQVNTNGINARFRIFPGDQSGGFQSNTGLLVSTGIPSNANGAQGDICLNSAGSGTMTTIYQKRAGVWVGIA